MVLVTYLVTLVTLMHGPSLGANGRTPRIMDNPHFSHERGTIVLRSSTMHDLTPDVVQAAATAAGEGMPLNLIADLIEVPRRTMMEWLEKGEAGDDASCRYVRFTTAVRKARAEFVQARLRKAIGDGKNPGGSQWALERLFPEFRQSTAVAVEHSGQLAVVDWRSAPLDEVLAAAGLPAKV